LAATLFFAANNQSSLVLPLYLRLIPTVAYHLLLAIPVHYLTAWLLRRHSKK
jgi:hypothetical protein